jgi:hypothetical protein
MKSLRLPQRTLAVITLVIIALGSMVILKPGQQDPKPRESITLID